MSVTGQTDQEAPRLLYAAHYRVVCCYLAVRTDADTVEDVAAETFLIAWRRSTDLPDHIAPWLLNTAREMPREPPALARPRLRPAGRPLP